MSFTDKTNIFKLLKNSTQNDFHLNLFSATCFATEIVMNFAIAIALACGYDLIVTDIEYCQLVHYFKFMV